MRGASAMFEDVYGVELLDLETWDAPDRLSSTDCETETGRDWLWRSARGEGEDDQ